MHTSHSTRTAHAHTRQQRSAAAHSHSADTLVASPATQVHQFETQELTDLLVCSEADKERRSSSTQTPTHTGLMTGPLLPPLQRLPDRPTNPKTLNSTSHNAANGDCRIFTASCLERDCTRQPLVFVALPPLPWMGCMVFQLNWYLVVWIRCNAWFLRRQAVFTKL
jgi:hypothetical protein